MQENSLLMSTTDTIPGKELQTLGLVQGNVVRAKDIGRAFAAGVRAIGGGEIKIYTDLLNEARTTATSRMQEQAKALGADAIVCIRMTTCSVMDGSSEVTIYGTAVKFV